MSCLRCVAEKDFFGGAVYKKKNCGEAAKWLGRSGKPCWLAAAVVAMLGGVALVAVGAAALSKAKVSTTGGEYYERLARYYEEDFPDFNQTTVSNIPGFQHVQATVPWSLVGANGTDQRSFQATALVGRVPRPAEMQNGVRVKDVAVSLHLTQSLPNGTTVTSVVTAPRYFLIDTNEGHSTKLDWVCLVVEHDAHGAPWNFSSTFQTCAYPFDMFVLPPDTYRRGVFSDEPINVRVISRHNPVLWLQAQSGGVLSNVRDVRSVTVPPQAPLFLGLGVALVAVGLTALLYFLACVSGTEAGEVPPWEVEVGANNVEKMSAAKSEAPKTEDDSAVSDRRSKTEDDSAVSDRRSAKPADPRERSGAYSARSTTTAEDEDDA